MRCHLDEELFELVKSGVKDVEVRINDAKRKKLHKGDKITFFKRPLDDEVIIKKVKDLEYYNNFDEVVEQYEMKRIYKANCSREEYLNLMHKFYATEELEKDGAVTIIFE